MNNSINNHQAGIYQELKGFYKVAVLDKNNELVWEQGDWNDNLILNQGLDHLYDASICECFTYGIAGTGTRVNSIDSGGSTAAVSGTTLTMTPSGTFTDFTSGAYGYPTAAQVGDMIKFADGTEVKVVSVGGATTLTVSPSGTVADQTFVIWKTSQTTLNTERSRSIDYETNGDIYNSSSFSSSVVTHRRTWNFPFEAGLSNYTEVGVGWSATQDVGVFSRILLPAIVPVSNGQRLRLVYQLQVTYLPIVSQSFFAVISGMSNTSASQAIQRLSGSLNSRYWVSWVTASGVTIATTPFLEPYNSNAGFFLSNVSNSIAPFGSAVARESGSAWTTTFSKASYTAGSFTCDKSVTFSGASFSSTNLRSMGFGSGSAASASNQAFVIVFDNNQTKTTSQTLSLTYRWTWGRTLV